MSKKPLNQNSKFNLDFIKTFEPNFIFNNEPQNRYDSEIIETTNDSFKKKNLSELQAQIDSIENCKLKDDAKKSFLGHGKINSPIMLIGESPSEEEEEMGLVFQGEKGELLKKMFSAINISISNIYFAFSINYRTPDDRRPSTNEIKRYSRFLKDHISIINPKLLILMGSTAMEAVTGLNCKISDERGKWKEIIIKNTTIPIMISFSPSYLIRFPENKKYAWKDLKMIKQKIQDLKIKI